MKNPFIDYEPFIISGEIPLSSGHDLIVEAHRHPKRDEINIFFESGTYSKPALTELARILTELAEVMEE